MRTHRQKIVRRINFLCIFFFCAIFGCIIYSVDSNEFYTGFKEGMQAGINSQEKSEPIGPHFFDIPLERKAETYDTFILADSNFRINARYTGIDIKVTGNKIPKTHLLESMLLRIISVACYLAIFIIVILMLILLRNSARAGNIFDGIPISFIRTIGILLIIGSFLSDLSRYLEVYQIDKLLQGTSWQVSFNIFSFRDILIGILILVIAEIFAIGHDISEDQKLTI